MIKRLAVKLQGKRGQGMIEYLLGLLVFVGIILAFANGAFKTSVDGTYNAASGTLDGAQGVLSGVDLGNAANW
jgi:hypothetical protein